MVRERFAGEGRVANERVIVALEWIGHQQGGRWILVRDTRMRFQCIFDELSTMYNSSILIPLCLKSSLLIPELRLGGFSFFCLHYASC